MDLIPEKFNPNWKKDLKARVKGIGKDDLLKARNGVERCKPPSSRVPGKVFTFGKYKGKSYTEIQESDPNYFSWCEENIENFNK